MRRGGESLYNSLALRAAGDLVYSIEGAADRLSDPRVVLYFGYFRFTRTVTVIAKASAIVTVGVMTNIRCLLSAQRGLTGPEPTGPVGVWDAGNAPSPHIQRKFQLR